MLPSGVPWAVVRSTLSLSLVSMRLTSIVVIVVSVLMSLFSTFSVSAAGAVTSAGLIGASGFFSGAGTQAASVAAAAKSKLRRRKIMGSVYKNRSVGPTSIRTLAAVKVPFRTA